MALATTKQEKTSERLASLTLPDGASWASRARHDALARVRQSGLPGRRDEYWKYTDPQPLAQTGVIPAAPFHTDESVVFGQIDRLKIVFRDGVFDPAASDDLGMDGIEIERLSDAMQKDIHWAQEFYGVLEKRGQTPVERPLATLNTAIANDGVVIRVTGRPARPVSLIYLHEQECSDPALHHVIRVEEGAALTLLENGPAAARFNKVLEVDVAPKGAFRHIRAQGRDPERRAVTHIFGRLDRDSLFKSFTLTANGAMTRNDVVLEISGENAVAHVAGAALGDGEFHHDDTVFITHNAVGGESRQVFKKVLRNGATGVFQGKILVNQGAQKTDGYQLSQALLLDGDSQFLAKPELEIYADDVACSHGSTSGEIDDDALFYLRARGVPEAEAQDMLTRAFLAEAIEEIDDPAIAGDILGRLESWLQRRG